MALPYFVNLIHSAQRVARNNPSERIYSHGARLDLLRIWNRIAEENIDAADKVKTELRPAMEQLVRMPGMGHRRFDVKNPRYRFWPVYSYLIAYYPDTKPLTIVRVVHGAQNIKRSFDHDKKTAGASNCTLTPNAGMLLHAHNSFRKDTKC